jgi:hypothetical protein
LQLLRDGDVSAPLAHSVPPPPRPKTRVAGAAAAIAATGALACGMCCVLPFALPAAILAVSGGALAWFAGLMPWLTAIAMLAVAGGWLWVALLTQRARRRPALSTLLTMGASTVLLTAALVWPLLEGPIVGLLRR